MLTKEITSLQHPFIKHLVKLRTDRKYRYEHKSVFIAGHKLVNEHLNIKIIIVEKSFDGILPSAEEKIVVNEPLLKKITDLEHPEPVAALVDMPTPTDLKEKKYILVLDQIADPGNLGNLLRTALALGWEGAFLVEGTVDPFNDKALRAAKGATFRLPFRIGTWEELEKLIQENHLMPFVADINGNSFVKAKTNQSCMLILGNESHGPSHFAKSRFTRISIPMTPSMESLNVGAAGAILMHYLRSL